MRSWMVMGMLAWPAGAWADVVPGCGGSGGWEEDTDACVDPPCDTDADTDVAAASLAPVGLGGLAVGLGLVVAGRRSRGDLLG